MKNINIVIYGFLGLVIVSLLGVIIYLYQDGAKKIELIKAENNNATEALKKETACLPIINFSMKKAIEKAKSTVYTTEADSNVGILRELSEGMDTTVKYCGTEKEVAESWIAGIEEVTKSSQENSSEIMAFKALLASSVTIVKTCIYNKKFVNAPEANNLVCEGYGNWSDFREAKGGSWGGCDFEIDKKAGTFKYCATFGEIKAVCTQDGCNF